MNSSAEKFPLVRIFTKLHRNNRSKTLSVQPIFQKRDISELNSTAMILNKMNTIAKSTRVQLPHPVMLCPQISVETHGGPQTDHWSSKQFFANTVLRSSTQNEFVKADQLPQPHRASCNRSCVANGIGSGVVACQTRRLFLPGNTCRVNGYSEIGPTLRSNDVVIKLCFQGRHTKGTF